MKDNTPHKPRPLYSPWPIVVLLLFFGAAISLWSNHHVLAIIVGAVGIFIYGFLDGFLDRIRTRMIHEELSLRELFRNW